MVLTLRLCPWEWLNIDISTVFHPIILFTKIELSSVSVSNRVLKFLQKMSTLPGRFLKPQSVSKNTARSAMGYIPELSLHIYIPVCRESIV